MARWVRRRDRAGRVQAIANQQPGALERFGVTRGEGDRAAWTIDPQGRRLEGAAAINRVLGEMGGVWPLVAALYRLPPAAAVEEAFYRWFARNRSRFARFGVTPECDEPGARCA
ncbi:MAG TPA: DCC1-like thiol-disulfide oxidoreductase family protein [Gemmatimonadales bacterium]|jgi:predicted DCC family thiol-disulfide oxidoreductase YuxK|nr:DCC1-like thiol-disulfide oxidoreductase family protein [Gemmatimonadales bacterium]